MSTVSVSKISGGHDARHRVLARVERDGRNKNDRIVRLAREQLGELVKDDLRFLASSYSTASHRGCRGDVQGFR